MAEWSIAAVLKTVVPVRVPGVRIPLPPLRKFAKRSIRAKDAIRLLLFFVFATPISPEIRILLKSHVYPQNAAFIGAKYGLRRASTFWVRRAHLAMCSPAPSKADASARIRQTFFGNGGRCFLRNEVLKTELFQAPEICFDVAARFFDVVIFVHGGWDAEGEGIF